MLEIYDLRTEYLENPLGLDKKMPRFSWKMEKLPAMENPNSANGLKSPKEKSSPLWDKA